MVPSGFWMHHKHSTKCVFDELPQHYQDLLEPRVTRGTMADGTQLTFLGLIALELRLKGVPLKEIFVVGPVQEDIISGMPFLSMHLKYLSMVREYAVLRGTDISNPATDRGPNSTLREGRSSQLLLPRLPPRVMRRQA